jgi:integrase/recombinase XerD
METILLDLAEQEGVELLTIRVPYDPILIAAVKKIQGVRWDPDHRVWKVPPRKGLLMELRNSLGELARLDESELRRKLNQVKEQQRFRHAYDLPLERFSAWLKSKRYSKNTQKTYLDAIGVFLKFMKGKPINEIVLEDIIRFNNDYILYKAYSSSYQNQVVNALKLFFRVEENKLIDLEEIHRPRRSFKLPNVLSKEEVRQILDSLKNLKHRVMLSLIYACGLRRSELLELRLTDIMFERKLLLIRQSKGNKDRVVPLSQKLQGQLEEYIKSYRPQHYLFEGQNGGKYSETSLAKVLKNALMETGNQKAVSLHWLRHSYATHLLESGTDLRYIQELLGHKSSRTTEIYTHVSQKKIQGIRSPFDDL